MPISNELKQLYASSGDDVILNTLELNHPSWPNPFFIVQDWQDLTADLEVTGTTVVFEKYAFGFSGPDNNERGTQSINITFDSVSGVLVDLLETAMLDMTNTPITVIYRIYLDSDKTAPQNNPPLRLSMRKVKVDLKKITGRAEVVSLINRKFPNEKYDDTFSGIINL